MSLTSLLHESSLILTTLKLRLISNAKRHTSTLAMILRLQVWCNLLMVIGILGQCGLNSLCVQRDYGDEVNGTKN